MLRLLNAKYQDIFNSISDLKYENLEKACEILLVKGIGIIEIVPFVVDEFVKMSPHDILVDNLTKAHTGTVDTRQIHSVSYRELIDDRKEFIAIETEYMYEIYDSFGGESHKGQKGAAMIWRKDQPKNFLYELQKFEDKDSFIIKVKGPDMKKITIDQEVATTLKTLLTEQQYKTEVGS